MIDLHAHLLPGVDDGAGTLDQAVEMCRMAFEDGVRTVVATPHQRNDRWSPCRAELLAAFDGLRAAAPAGLDIRLGGEILLDSDVLDDVDRLPGGELLPLAGTRHLLVEFPMLLAPADPGSILHEMVIARWTPVVAHPERMPWLAGRDDLLEEMVDRGALLQVTAGSLLGTFGRAPQAFAESLLDRGMAAVIASDAHDTGRRAPVLSAARRHVAARWGEDAAVALFEANPAAVLANRPLVPSCENAPAAGS